MTLDDAINSLTNAINSYENLSRNYDELIPLLKKNYKLNILKTKRISIKVFILKKNFLDLHSSESVTFNYIKKEKSFNNEQLIESYENLFFNIQRRISYLDSYFIHHSFTFTVIVAYWSLILGLLALLISILSLIPVVTNVSFKVDSNVNIPQKTYLLDKKDECNKENLDI